MIGRHAVATAAIASVLAAFPSCKPRDASPADAGAPAERPPPDIRVTADRTDLVFSYSSTTGAGFATATKIDAIPEQSRQTVIVTDLSLSPAERQADRYIYIADARAPRDDGTYPVAIASRYAFEAELAQGSGATAPADDGQQPAAGGGAREVVIYTTSWCGVCGKAKRLLDQLRVPYVDKDIEASRSAAEELAKKSAAAGIRPGGVPVIDVGGTLLQGLDEATLRSVLKTKGFI
jgi:glutaredoxin